MSANSDSLQDTSPDDEEPGDDKEHPGGVEESSGDAPEEPASSLLFEFQNTGPPQRLDIYLAEKLPDHSRTFIQKLIDDGQVMLDPAPREIKRSLKISTGAKVRVVIPPPRKLNLAPLDIPLKVVYEDNHLAVIDKPGNLAVHPSPNQSCNTLVNALLYHLRDLSSIGGVERPGIVHRLDKETSGVLVVAKNDFAHNALARQFKERKVHKTYLAIVRGEPAEWEGRIDLALGKSYSNAKKQMVRTDGSGREAVTDYRVLEKYRGYALLEVYPHTGRTHQIRVHLLCLRLPIACDKLYGRERRVFLSDLRGEPRRLEETPLLERQALHAASITIQHPVTRQEMAFSAPLHADMLGFLKALERHCALGR